MDYPCNDLWGLYSVEVPLFTVHCTTPGVHRVLVADADCHCVLSAAPGGCCGPLLVRARLSTSVFPSLVIINPALYAVYGRHVPPIRSGRPCIFHIAPRLPALTSPFSSVTPCQSGLGGRFGEKQRDLFVASRAPFLLSVLNPVVEIKGGVFKRG